MIACLHGLGNKLTYLARAMCMAEAPPIDWGVGPECPVGHRVVFPDGIPGVTITDSPVGGRLGFLWSPAYDEALLGDALLRVFTAMQLPAPEACELGVMFRKHFWKKLDPSPFLPELEEALASTQGPVATLCDSAREDILSYIGEDRAIPQVSREPRFDLDRDPEMVRPYLFEWWRLLHCRRIVTNCPQSSITWPHRFLVPALHSAR